MKIALCFLLFLTASWAQLRPSPAKSFNFWDELPEEPANWKGIVQNIHEFIKLLKSSSFPTAVARNISQQCIDDSLSYVHNYYILTPWALQMHESSGSRPEGLFGGFQMFATGLFDECLAVNASTFQGKYCTVFFDFVDAEPVSFEDAPVDDGARGNWITFFQWLQLLGLITGGAQVKPQVADFAWPQTMFFNPNIGFCIPSSCSSDDFRTAVSQLVGGFAIGNQSVRTITDESLCSVQNKEPPKFDGPAIAVLVTLGTIGALVVIGTLFECSRLILKKPIDPTKDSWFARALHCFSAYNNGRKLLSTRSSGSDNLSCVHGIRFLSTTWVVMGHVWSQPMTQPNYSRFLLFMDAYKWEMQTIINATVSVDSFFLLSGMLVAYMLLKELEKSKGKFNVVLFYVHRYLRLTPVYAIILGFVATLMVYLGKGPVWFLVPYLAEGCRNGWWYNFLYINNFIEFNLTSTNYACMGETWYLANDFQMFILSPLVIYPLWRWKKQGRFWWLTLMLATLAANFAIYAVYELPATTIPTRTKDNILDYMIYYYMKPWTRAPPYLVGIYLGLILHETRNSRVKIQKGLVFLAWILSAAVGLAIIYGLSGHLHADDEMTTATSMFYGSLHRAAWAVILSWVIFACTKGYGGFVNRLLSWRGFIPLSRLTYCVYLIHLSYIAVFYGHLRKPVYYTTFDQVHTYFGILVAVFGLAFIVSVTVEAPFLNLEKLIFTPVTRSKSLAVPPPADQDDQTKANGRGIDNKGLVSDPS